MWRVVAQHSVSMGAPGRNGMCSHANYNSQTLKERKQGRVSFPCPVAMVIFAELVIVADSCN